MVFSYSLGKHFGNLRCFFVVTRTREHYWHLAGRDRRCLRHSSITKNWPVSAQLSNVPPDTQVGKKKKKHIQNYMPKNPVLYYIKQNVFDSFHIYWIFQKSNCMHFQRFYLVLLRTLPRVIQGYGIWITNTSHMNHSLCMCSCKMRDSIYACKHLTT